MGSLIPAIIILLMVTGSVGVVTEEYGFLAYQLALSFLLLAVAVVLFLLWIFLWFGQRVDNEKNTLASSDQLAWSEGLENPDGSISPSSVTLGVIEETSYHSHRSDE